MKFRDRLRQLRRKLSPINAADMHSGVARTMQRFRVDTVLDVGANEGQYAQQLLKQKFSGQVISFEPVANTFQTLNNYASRSERWSCHQFALGDQNGIREINVARASSFSSLLIPTKYVQDIDRNSEILNTESIVVRKLSDCWDELKINGSRIWMKLDVQGFENEVVLGAKDILHKITAIQTELSLMPIYESQTAFDATIRQMNSIGFTEIYTLWPGFCDHQTGRLLELDALFVRREFLEQLRAELNVKG